MEQEENIARFAQYLIRLSPGRRTAIDYVSDVYHFVAECPKPWRNVTVQDIDAFVDHQREAGLSPAAVQRRVLEVALLVDSNHPAQIGQVAPLLLHADLVFLGHER